MNENHYIWVVEESQSPRLDKYLCDKLDGFSRSRIQGLVEEGKVTLDGEKAAAKTKPKVGQVVEIWIDSPRELCLEPEDIPIEIVYQDADLAVINKPQGMVVHPAPGNYSGTLVNALLYHLDGLSGINGMIRPGIVHRIDKDTSGLLVVAKNDSAHQNLAEQIKEKQAKRTYLALVHGNIKAEEGIIDAPIGRSKRDRKKMAVVSDGKEAVTYYWVLERFGGQFTLVKAQLSTGQTHQIRVHFSHIGMPVVGDPIYGPARCPFPFLKGQLLHAAELELKHPTTGERMVFRAEIPSYFERVLTQLREKYGAITEE